MASSGSGAAAVAMTVDLRVGIEDFVQGAPDDKRLAILSGLLSARRTRTVAFAIGADDEAGPPGGSGGVAPTFGRIRLFGLRGGAWSGRPR